MNIAICDDDLLYMNQVKEMIEKWGKEHHEDVSIYLFNHGDALINSYQKSHIEVILLDIMMPLLNGMETAHEIRKNDSVVKIIFLTSSPEFALESYDVKAYSYLLKPVTYEKLEETLNECVKTFAIDPKHLILKTALGYQKIYFHEIEYAEAQNKKVHFHLRSGNFIESVDPFHFFEDQLSLEDGFFKCHRSYLVYFMNVEHFTSSEITTKSGEKIPIARAYSKAFKEAYFAQMFQDS